MALGVAFHLDLIEATYSVVPSWNHERTAAPWWRFYWNDREGWTALFGGRRHALGPDRVVLVAPETNFIARSSRPAGHLWVHFNLGPPLHAVRGHIYELEVDPLFSCGVAECRESLAARDELRIGLRVPALCAWTLARVETLPLLRNEPNSRLAALLQVAGRRPGGPIARNSELARELDMHPNAFVRWFKHEFGTTPHSFLLGRRIERACALLRYTERSIEEIGEELGFCDRYHFARTFRRYRGISPAAFRSAGI